MDNLQTTILVDIIIGYKAADSHQSKAFKVNQTNLPYITILSRNTVVILHKAVTVADIHHIVLVIVHIVAKQVESIQMSFMVDTIGTD